MCEFVQWVFGTIRRRRNYQIALLRSANISAVEVPFYGVGEVVALHGAVVEGGRRGLPGNPHWGGRQGFGGHWHGGTTGGLTISGDKQRLAGEKKGILLQETINITIVPRIWQSIWNKIVVTLDFKYAWFALNLFSIVEENFLVRHNWDVEFGIILFSFLFSQRCIKFEQKMYLFSR